MPETMYLCTVKAKTNFGRSGYSDYSLYGARCHA